MEVTFRQDVYSSYMILSGGDVDRTAYPIHMITRNDIPGFLRCHIEEMDGRLYLYYDITSMKPLKSVMESGSVSSGMLRMLLQAVPSAMEILSSYLLKPDGMQLSTGMIYTDEEQKKLWFCYYPDQSAHFAEALVSLGEDILSGLDHGDREAVMLGYAFYQECCGLKGEVPADFFSRFLKSREAPSDGEGEAYREEEQQKNLTSAFFNDNDDDTQKEKKKGRKKKRNGKKERGKKKEGWWQGFLRRYAGKEEKAEPEPESENDVREDLDIPPAGSEYSFSSEEEKTKMLSRKTAGKVTVRARLTAVADDSGVFDTARSAGLSEEAVFELKETEYIVGRSRKAATLILSSPAVSRVHARLVWQEVSCGGAYFVKDMDSRNATMVNGKILKPEEQRRLCDGDMIMFADRLYRYEDGVGDER